jgi:PKHD-type hydroxylase
MGGAQPMRADLAMTIFLSSPDSYEGGELVIESPSGEQEVKLAAGEAVVYPATTLHRVTPVTRGVRMAAVTWIQCAVRDERLRAILGDLNEAVHHAEAVKDAAAMLLLSKCYHNLLRYAVDL